MLRRLRRKLMTHFNVLRKTDEAFCLVFGSNYNKPKMVNKYSRVEEESSFLQLFCSCLNEDQLLSKQLYLTCLRFKFFRKCFKNKRAQILESFALDKKHSNPILKSCTKRVRFILSQNQSLQLQR